MKRTILLLATTISLAAGPVLAAKANPCAAELNAFDAAFKTSTASKSNLDKAKLLREQAANSCADEGGKAHGVADLTKAMKMIGAKS